MVKQNLNDKLKESKTEIHSTCECVNLVMHTNFTAPCVIEADFSSISSMLKEAVFELERRMLK